MVSADYPPHLGGVATHVSNLVAQLDSLGVMVDVVTQERGAARPASGRVPGTRNVTVTTFSDHVGNEEFPMSPGLLRAVIRRRKAYDIVHAHDLHTVPFLVACLASRAPLVLTPHYHGIGHSSLASLLHKAYDPIAQRIILRAAKVLCCSNAEAALLLEAVPRLRGRVAVSHSGVEAAHLDQSAPGLLRTGSTILVAGRLVPHKRVDVAIRAMAFLPPIYKLIIAGGGAESSRLAQLSCELGLSDRVIFVGRVSSDELRRLYRLVDLVMALSTAEAFGLTVLEGAAAGAAVLASDIAAHREVADIIGGGIVHLTSVASGPLDVAQEILGYRDKATTPVDLTRIPTWEGHAKRCVRCYEEALGSQEQ